MQCGAKANAAMHELTFYDATTVYRLTGCCTCIKSMWCLWQRQSVFENIRYSVLVVPSHASFS